MRMPIRPGYKACRANLLLIAAALILVGSKSARAEMAEGDAWNVGSVFAAGTQCEARGHIPQGQVTPLMVRAIQRIPTKDGERIRDGYQEGLKRTAIYSKNFGRWMPFPLTADGCKQVQYAVTQYKTMFDMVDTGNSTDGTGLKGAARSSFVAEATNACLREHARDPVPLPATSINQYCQCYANGVADRVSEGQMRAQETMDAKEQAAAMRPIVQAAAKACITSAIKSR
jgi:predicted RecA/RadA family phage recombinase